MARLKGKNAAGAPVEVETGAFDARQALAELMNAETPPELSKRAADLLAVASQAGKLTPEQSRRLIVQLSLSDTLGILDTAATALYPDDDAANLTLLSIKHKRERGEFSDPAEAARQLLQALQKLKSPTAVFSRQLFASGDVSRLVVSKENKKDMERGLSLIGERTGLAGGSKAVHAYKLGLAAILSANSEHFKTSATLGGIPPAILSDYFGFVPEKRITAQGKEIALPTIIASPADLFRATHGQASTMSSQDFDEQNKMLEYLRRQVIWRKTGGNMIIGEPMISTIKPILLTEYEDKTETRRQRYAYLITLSLEFVLDTMQREGREIPKDYVSIDTGKVMQLSGGQIFNALMDYALFHSNKSGIHKTTKDKLKDYLLGLCPTYKGRKEQLDKDTAKALESLAKTGVCSVKYKGDNMIFEYARKRK